MSTVVLVVLILLGVGAIQAAIWIPLLGAWRRRSKAFVDSFTAQAGATGESLVRGPEPAVYRGGTGPYSKVKGNGTMILTDRRLVFRKLTGGMVEVPLAEVTGVRQAKGFNRARVGGMTHLIVATSQPAEVGFFVDDLAGWERALAGRAP